MISIRKKSDKYLFYEALERRLPKNHSFWPDVQKILRKEGGGYAGELRVDRELSESQFFGDYVLLKNLLVGNEVSYCQIDSLILYSKFVLIIEVKNIPGILRYDKETHQLTRQRDNGPIEGMGNPEDQLQRSKRFVKRLMVQQNMTMPIHGMIVFSNPSSILDKPFPNCLAIHVSGLYQALENLHQLYADQTTPHFDTRKVHQFFVLNEPTLSPKNQSHIPAKVFSDLLKGVLCPNCVMTKLNYRSKFWRCAVCKYKSEESHITALQEYRILFGEKITTQEWMNFTDMKSVATTKRMLSKSNLEKIGGNKNRKWLIRKNNL